MADYCTHRMTDCTHHIPVRLSLSVQLSANEQNALKILEQQRLECTSQDSHTMPERKSINCMHRHQMTTRKRPADRHNHADHSRCHTKADGMAHLPVHHPAQPVPIQYISPKTRVRIQCEKHARYKDTVGVLLQSSRHKMRILQDEDAQQMSWCCVMARHIATRQDMSQEGKTRDMSHCLRIQMPIVGP